MDSVTSRSLLWGERGFIITVGMQMEHRVP